MRYSYVTYSGNGSVKQFSVTFPYINKDHVSVTVDGVSAPFTWFNDATVQITTTPPSGSVVKIQRTTPKNSPLADFNDASTLTETALDLATTQNLYVAQEGDDKAEDIKAEAVEAAVEAATTLARSVPTATGSDVGRVLMALPGDTYGWSAAFTLDGSGNVAASGTVTAQHLRGGAGDAGTLKAHGTNNLINFRWDGTRVAARVDETADIPLARYSDLASYLPKNGYTTVSGWVRFNNDGADVGTVYLGTGDHYLHYASGTYTLNAGNLAVGGRVLASMLEGGPGNAGHLAGWGGHAFCFRWDGSRAFYRVNEAVEHGIATVGDLGNYASVAYVNANFASASWATAALADRVFKGGDTMNGALTLAYVNPTLSLHHPGVKHWQVLADGASNLVFRDGGNGAHPISMDNAGRVYHQSPRAGGTGYGIVSSDNRFGPWSWGGGGHIALDVDGQAYGITVFASDLKLKEDVQPACEEILPLVRMIDFIDFRYKPLPGDPEGTINPLQRGGVAAQQLQQIKPEWVQTVTLPGSEATSLNLNAPLLLTNALKAIAELDAKVQSLTAQMEALSA